ncbi:TetR/AcrR family transcriptional regulator [Chitinimonas sp.]|uniref:TetR/AcrR family transcriptional regulator n=1 Tax=Chitinimonas sp. TaxID=1934313 RepID=UPI002F939456
MSRKSNTEARRAEIVEAMLAVMAQQGYEKATIQAVAKQAGLAPGLIHYHFKSKQEILLALVQAIARYAQQRYQTALGEAQAPVARLQAYLNAQLGLGEGAAPQMVAAWVMIGAEAVRQAEVREVYQTVIAAELASLTQMMGDCLVEAGRSRAAAPDLAAGLLALMTGAFQLSSAAQAVMPTGYAAEAAIAYAVNGIAAAPQA